ncbi:multidrug effflux MFS transporter [Salmonella enterica subsp. enterica]|nr:multidrug effflux MFS transporter [Salmonella enterica subsp. enterica serovar Adjame]ECJ2943113.1 multidrug effflux MFS transporter [Salmonella enterica subsp. enterica serovar Adjame]ECJ3639389.1 multidrug effflux MFS transporter [Salmonella enterica subsp. enterica serovar Adjame]ECJ8732026.1 multidrug effflux MFS transporter [Salmonella enterica subsp. enterica serovar Adjame]EEO5387116.1 multidrug effflux MFS transporter [Salmonella enterica subsp. enterica serovar Adjame]
MVRIYIYLILAASVSALATDMIIPALPVLQRDLGTDYATIQLTISGFLVIYALSQLMSGFAGERLGKVRILTASFIIFLAGSLVCFMAESLQMLMFGRILQAVGAGAGPVLSRAIAKDSLPPKTLKRALSDISSASAVVPLIAPLMGGIILGHFRWNAIFLVMAVFSVITIFFTPGSLSERSDNNNNQEPSQGTFITPEFIHGTILVSLMLSSLFCYISLSPVIFMQTFSLSTIHYSLLFSASVFLFIVGNQFSKIEKANNPFILFILNALSLLPFLTESHSLPLCIAGAMLFNFTLGAYYPVANYIALQIKGTRSGVAASVTGFTQTVSAGSISFFAASMTENGIGFSSMLGLSSFTLAGLSVVVVTILKVTQWKTGKRVKSTVH